MAAADDAASFSKMAGMAAVDADRGSLPNLDELVSQGVYMEREEAARS